MFYENFKRDFSNNVYVTNSIEEKIELHLALHRVFNRMLEVTDDIKKTKNLEILEQETLRKIQFDLIEDIYKCENEINNLSEDINDQELLDRIEAYGIDGTIHKITGSEKLHIDNVEKIKVYLFLNEVYSIEMKSLKNQKASQYINKFEKQVLRDILERLSSYIIGNYDKICFTYRYKIPYDFVYRRELKDAIEDSQLEINKALDTGTLYSKKDDPEFYQYIYPTRSRITVDYLKDEILDLRKLKTEKWYARRYDKYLASYRPYSFGYIFNFRAILNGLHRYSYRKQLEVNLVFLRVFRAQISALDIWYDKKDTLIDYEEIIFDYMRSQLYFNYVKYSIEIASTFLYNIKKDYFYNENIIKELEEKVRKHILLDSFHLSEDSLTLNIDLTSTLDENYEKELEEAKEAYNHKYNSLSCSFEPYNIYGDLYKEMEEDLIEKPIIDHYNPDRSNFIAFLLIKHELETVEIEALLEYYRKLRGKGLPGYEKQYEKIITGSLCAYKTSQVLLTDEEIMNMYNLLPVDYPNIDKILNKIRKFKVKTFETVKEIEPDKEENDLRAITDPNVLDYVDDQTD